MPKRKDMEAMLDEAIDQSFPASDPLSSNVVARVGPPDRKPADIGAPARAPKRRDEPGTNLDEQSLDEQIAGSFPASDPPSYNVGHRVGQPQRAAEVAPKTRKKARSPKRK